MEVVKRRAEAASVAMETAAADEVIDFENGVVQTWTDLEWAFVGQCDC
jgi:hypothetical protein